ncbi:hypothetical protein BDZ45DRAFT_681844 [Acephala macrosclerotiorum]|nr:hypothetical protein BDZ45DRAFT_681844 [Acephala macrosclerotiorum]
MKNASNARIARPPSAALILIPAFAPGERDCEFEFEVDGFVEGGSKDELVETMEVARKNTSALLTLRVHTSKELDLL